MAAKEMRAVLGEGLAALMAADERIVVVDADLARANGTLSLRQQFPGRAFDMGVAEANMASVAAGLASYGFIPFIGSFTPFATRRICDQIAISICYARQNVKILGTDPGIAAELNGGTHMSFEDIGVLRSIPGIVIFEPVDNVQLAQALPALVAYDGPVYIRMFRKIIEDVFDPATYTFDLFCADVLREGGDVSIFASGILVQEAVRAVETLAAEGIDAELINPHTIKPIDEAAIVASARKTGAVVVCENHNLLGGLTSAVSEVLGRECPTRIHSIGLGDEFGVVGTLSYLRDRYRLTAEEIVRMARAAVAEKQGRKAT